jgi:putative transposase
MRPRVATRFLIRDRGSNFTRSFDAAFPGHRHQDSAHRRPGSAHETRSANAWSAPWRRELLDRVLILGERHLRAVLAEYQAHYNAARPHQGIVQRVPDDERDAPRATDVDRQQIRRKPVLNGLINEYAHTA